MARLAVFASGNGSNFQAIAESLKGTPHELCCVICDRENAGVHRRAGALGIPVHLISYRGRTRAEAESAIIAALDQHEIQLIALAGYMRILSPSFISRYENHILNVHPSLLPKHPGIHSIQRAYESGDRELGVTVHIVDQGVDTGPVLCQESFTRSDESLEEVEAEIHAIEHRIYPKAVLNALSEVDSQQSEVNT
jgi:phosphoribosylglycinamide formyltransferase-1